MTAVITRGGHTTAPVGICAMELGSYRRLHGAQCGRKSYPCLELAMDTPAAVVVSCSGGRPHEVRHYHLIQLANVSAAPGPPPRNPSCLTCRTHRPPPAGVTASSPMLGDLKHSRPDAHWFCRAPRYQHTIRKTDKDSSAPECLLTTASRRQGSPPRIKSFSRPHSTSEMKMNYPDRSAILLSLGREPAAPTPAAAPSSILKTSRSSQESRPSPTKLSARPTCGTKQARPPHSRIHLRTPLPHWTLYFRRTLKESTNFRVNTRASDHAVAVFPTSFRDRHYGGARWRAQPTFSMRTAIAFLPVAEQGVNLRLSKRASAAASSTTNLTPRSVRVTSHRIRPRKLPRHSRAKSPSKKPNHTPGNSRSHRRQRV